MKKTLKNNFFLRPARFVAEDLLGSRIVSLKDGERISLEINEVEVYEGVKDRASHASRGKTKRNWPMFERGGIFYIYLVYGFHLMLNVVTGDKDFPSAILIRGAGEYNGPGKLSKALGIDLGLSGRKVMRKKGVWFEESDNMYNKKIVKLPRVGVDYAGKYWKSRLLRFKSESYQL